MKILVVFTGGTIGSAVSDGWIAPSDDMKYLLISKFREKTGDNIHFDAISPYTVLSENLSSEHLNKLAQCVRDNINGYDGVIVTHGTDTLQYSAAALAYSVDCKVPVVLVSSNYPLEDKRANGLDNFIAAVEFIKTGGSRGVFVSYRNFGEDTCIHHATKVVAHTENFDEIYSIDKTPCAVYSDKIKINTDCCSESEYKGDIIFCENPQILCISAMPGDNFRYDISKCKAVILRPYHSGTLNTSSEGFIDFCNRLKSAQIPVFVVNGRDGVTYESAKEYKNLGLTVLPGSPFVAVYMKLWAEMSWISLKDL